MDENKVRELICEFVGEYTVAEQITAALEYKANASEQIKLQEEVKLLKAEVERLKGLVGEGSVAEQITAALIG